MIASCPPAVQELIARLAATNRELVALLERMQETNERLRAELRQVALAVVRPSGIA